MTRPYSLDLRDCGFGGRAEYRHGDGSAPVTALPGVGRTPGKVGGRKIGIPSGSNRDWLLERRISDFTLHGLVAELAERGVKVDYVQVWRFAHAEGLSFKKTSSPPSSCSSGPPGGVSTCTA